jgi:5-methylcytosine-specific restriction enzyme subunit McrC
MLKTIHEYDPIDELTDGQLAIMEKINSRFKNGPLYDWASRNTIRWKSFVGVVRIGDITYEILPKIHRHDVDEGADRTYLLHMLAESGTLPFTLDDIATFATHQWTLLDLVIYAFANETRHQLHKGRVHRYEVTKEDRSSLRGKLLVGEHAARDPLRQLRFPCQFTQFTPNTAINNLLRTAAREGMRLTRHPVVRQSLSWVEQQFDDVDLLARPYTRTVPTIIHDRTTSRYTRACTLAEQILHGLAPHIHSGKTEYFAMLFDMNVLFEQWVAARYQRELANGDVRVSAQESTLSLFQSANRRVFYLKPDIVIRDDAEERITIIDTKWKLLSDDKSYYGVSQADAYQMFAYMERYKAQKVVLMYPHHPGLGRPSGKQAEYSHADDHGRTLEVWTVDIDPH